MIKSLTVELVIVSSKIFVAYSSVIIFKFRNVAKVTNTCTFIYLFCFFMEYVIIHVVMTPVWLNLFDVMAQYVNCLLMLNVN
jgi:hypothetical protein